MKRIVIAAMIALLLIPLLKEGVTLAASYGWQSLPQFGPTGTPASTSTTGGHAPDELTVSSVADGDTFTGRTRSGVRVKVRMLGIDAPEIAHGNKSADCGGGAAARALTGLMRNRTVTVTTDPRSDRYDRYGRLLAYVSLNGTDVALDLIEGGFVKAWYPSGEPQPTRFGTYSRAQASARLGRVGQWAVCAELGR